jgi:hypothetical protein
VKDGTRALWFAIFVVVVGAVLSYLLREGGPFEVASGMGAAGKFGYDAVRDRKVPSAEDK